MYAPVGERWSLAVVHWWGGWAEGENVSIQKSRTPSNLIVCVSVTL